MKHHKRMDKEERRKQILKSALNVFIEKGYNGSTTMDIAKESQISEVTLFRYFNSKKQIFKEAVEPIILTSLKESINEAKDLEVKMKFRHILHNRIEFVSENQEVIKLILMESRINPEIADFNFIDQITNLLGKLIKELEIDEQDDGFLSRILLGSILSFLYLPKLDKEEIDSYVEKLLNKIIK